MQGKEGRNVCVVHMCMSMRVLYMLHQSDSVLLFTSKHASYIVFEVFTHVHHFEHVSIGYGTQSYLLYGMKTIESDTCIKFMNLSIYPKEVAFRMYRNYVIFSQMGER